MSDMNQEYDVVINSDQMGKGDETLVETLMKGFIHTLAERENKPKNLVFYGDGVRLTCKGSESLEDLEVLDKAGVNILSCGICTDFYELSDKLMVGGITTMKEVVDIMSSSNNIVMP